MSGNYSDYGHYVDLPGQFNMDFSYSLYEGEASHQGLSGQSQLDQDLIMPQMIDPTLMDPRTYPNILRDIKSSDADFDYSLQQADDTQNYTLSSQQADAQELSLDAGVPFYHPYSEAWSSLHGDENHSVAHMRPFLDATALMIPHQHNNNTGSHDSGYASQPQRAHTSPSHKIASRTRSRRTDEPQMDTSRHLDTDSITSEEHMSQPPLSNKAKLSSMTEALKCPIPGCGKQAHNQSGLKKHIAGHEKSHSCPMKHCPRHLPGQGFPNTNDLDRHMTGHHHHGLKKVYICPFTGCSTFNARKDNFSQHLKRIHAIQEKSAEMESCCLRSLRLWPDVPEEIRDAIAAAKDKKVSRANSSTGHKRSVTQSSIKEETASKRSRIDHEERREDPRDDLPVGRPTDFPSPLQIEPEALKLTGAHLLSTPQPLYGADPWTSPVSGPGFSKSNLRARHGNGEYYAHCPSMISPISPQTSLPSRGIFWKEETERPDPITFYQPQPMAPQELDSPALQRQRTGPGETHQLVYQNPHRLQSHQFPHGDIVSQVDTIHTELHNLQQNRPSAEIGVPAVVPRLQQQAYSMPRRLGMPAESTVYNELDDDQVSRGAVTEPGHEVRCRICAKPKTSRSNLQKHMGRHERKYGCLHDNCRNNKKNSNSDEMIINLDALNGLGWGCFGSKYDLIRHEDQCHIKSRQIVECFRCTGDHNFGGKPCHQQFPAAHQAYASHLMACGVIPQNIRQVMDTASIPANFNGKYWCGFCEQIIHNNRPSRTQAEQALSEEKILKMRLDERLDHIQKHMKEDRTSMGDWKYLGGGGRTKLVIDTEAMGMLQ